MQADESADCAVLCVAWQRTGMRNRRFHRPSWPNAYSKELGLPLESHFTVTSNCNLNMMLKIGIYKTKTAYGLIKDIRGLNIHV
jgi:hypothetical protein